jgi:hypothetical protein
MSKSIRPGPLGIRLTTYADLEKIVRSFARGDLNLLILLGGHGLGKSRALRQAMAGQACWLEGNASAFGLYCQLWHHQNRPVVLDDLDGLYRNHDGIRLLKSLTQTEPHKTVSWYTDAATFAARANPAGVSHQQPAGHHHQRMEDAQPQCGSLARSRARGDLRADAAGSAYAHGGVGIGTRRSTTSWESG